MGPTESAKRLREMIEKAIEDHVITHAEYETIMQLAMEDGHIDAGEQLLLSQLQSMLEDRIIRFSK